MPKKWITHVKKYHSEHPNILYKQAMKDAKPSYKKSQKGKGGGVSKPSDTTNPMPTPEELQIQSRQRERVRDHLSESRGDQLQVIGNNLLGHIVREKRLPRNIHLKIHRFLNH